MADLWKTSSVASLPELTNRWKTADKQVGLLCEKCIEDREIGASEIPMAIQYCNQCQKNICDRCCREHRRYRELKDHQLMPLGSQMKDGSNKSIVLLSCDKRSKVQMKLSYCKCEQVICKMCFAEESHSQKCSDIDKTDDKSREEITNYLKQMKIFLKESSEKIEKILKEQKKFHNRIENAEKAILKRGSEIKQTINRCTRSLLTELASIKNQGLKQLETEKEEGERHLTTVESLQLYLNDFISKDSSVEICPNELHGTIGDLNESHKRFIQREISSIQVSFEVSNFEDFVTRENILGAVIGSMNDKVMIPPQELEENEEAEEGEEAEEEEEEKEEEEEMKYDDVTIRSSIRLDLSASSSSCVIGVTKLDNKVFVLCQDPNSILVFEGQSPFHFMMKLNTSEIICLIAIASTEKSKCLFVIDGFDYNRNHGNRCIWKMTTDDHRLTKWVTTFDEAHPYSLSVSPDDYLLVLRCSSTASQLDIYGLDGRFNRRLSLPKDIRNPLHCIQKLNGEFIISHLDRKTKHWTISELSSDGKHIIRQFLPKDNSNDLLNELSYLSLDSDNNRLFVADRYNDRVILFDSNSLHLKQILPTNRGNGIADPLGLYYDSSQTRLFIQSAHKVVAFDLD